MMCLLTIIAKKLYLDPGSGQVPQAKGERDKKGRTERKKERRKDLVMAT